MKLDWNKAIKILKNGGVGVIPTDTLYGLVGGAFSKKAINRIYKIKNRDRNKKLIVLISSLNDLKKFKIKISKEEAKILEKFWPGEVSIILDDIAFRFPKKKFLLEILKRTGPLVAPSANRESEKPAENIKQAKEYFGNNVDFYLSSGTLKSEHSTLIRIKNGKIEVLRQGKVFLL
ncbi:MAG: L-threonylcarbamoyladenylate synthase [Candidatus Paceibacterota bacterium]|jgi:L-threonylcarbamoyladenylate synthase